jgi:hypothetical protein
VWVLTFDFQYEIGDFKDIVADNLSRPEPVPYIYIDPAEARAKVRVLEAMLVDKRVPEAAMEKYLRFYELGDTAVPLNQAVYNPRGPGTRRAIVMTPEIQFNYYIELNVEQTSRMVDKFQSLMAGTKAQHLREVLGSVPAEGRQDV